MIHANSTRWLIAFLAALLIGWGWQSLPATAQISPLPSPLETPHRATPIGGPPPPVSDVVPSRRSGGLVLQVERQAVTIAATATPATIRTQPRVVPFTRPLSMLLWRFHNWNK